MKRFPFPPPFPDSSRRLHSAGGEAPELKAATKNRSWSEAQSEAGFLGLPRPRFLGAAAGSAPGRRLAVWGGTVRGTVRSLGVFLGAPTLEPGAMGESAFRPKIWRPLSTELEVEGLFWF